MGWRATTAAASGVASPARAGRAGTQHRNTGDRLALGSLRKRVKSVRAVERSALAPDAAEGNVDCRISKYE